jgi:hypothetical protein
MAECEKKRRQWFEQVGFVAATRRMGVDLRGQTARRKLGQTVLASEIAVKVLLLGVTSSLAVRLEVGGVTTPSADYGRFVAVSRKQVTTQTFTNRRKSFAPSGVKTRRRNSHRSLRYRNFTCTSNIPFCLKTNKGDCRFVVQIKPTTLFIAKGISSGTKSNVLIMRFEGKVCVIICGALF